MKFLLLILFLVLPACTTMAAGAVVYFIDSATGTIYSVNDDGSNLQVAIRSADAGLPDNITVNPDAFLIYWRDVSTSPFTIKRAKVDGSNLQTIVTDSGVLDIGLDFFNSSLFFSTNAVDSGLRIIKKVSLNGLNEQTVYTSPSQSAGPFGLVVDTQNGHVYFVDEFDFSIKRVDVADGGNLTTIVSSSDSIVRRLAIDLENSRLFWTDQSAGKIFRANLDGTDITELASSFAPEGIDYDPINDVVYWSEFTPAQIRRVSANGGEATDLLSSSDTANLVSLSGVAVFDEGRLASAGLTPVRPTAEVNNGKITLNLERFSSLAALSTRAISKTRVTYKVDVENDLNRQRLVAKRNVLTLRKTKVGTNRITYQAVAYKKRSKKSRQKQIRKGKKGFLSRFKKIFTTQQSEQIEVVVD